MADIGKGLKVDDRVVLVDTGSNADGATGVILGTSFDHIFKSHIVLLDSPINNGEKAISITEACLERV